MTRAVVVVVLVVAAAAVGGDFAGGPGRRRRRRAAGVDTSWAAARAAFAAPRSGALVVDGGFGPGMGLGNVLRRLPTLAARAFAANRSLAFLDAMPLSEVCAAFACRGRLVAGLGPADARWDEASVAHAALKHGSTAGANAYGHFSYARFDAAGRVTSEGSKVDAVRADPPGGRVASRP